MAIGQLYSTQNVVVGQAACMVATATPNPTPCPAPSIAQFGDPFSLIPWTSVTLSSTKALTAGDFMLTYYYNGYYYQSASIPWNSPANSASSVTPLGLNQVIFNMLTAPTAPISGPGNGSAVGPALPMNLTDIVVSGGPLTTTGKTFVISLPEYALPGTWSVQNVAATPPVGGTLSITNSLWSPIGSTDAGWSFVSNKTTQEINIEEQSTPVMTTITTQTLAVQGELAEDVQKTLSMAYNMVANFHSPAAAQVGPPAVAAAPGYHQLIPQDVPLLYSVALIMANRFGYPRWIYIPTATCLANTTAAFRRASAKRMYTVDFSSVCPIGQIAIFNFDKPHP